MQTYSHHDTLVSTGGAVAGGVVGAVLGSLFGPIGVALGAAAGGLTGASAGEQISEEIDYRDHLIDLSQSFMKQDYYVSEMEWEDYEAAYRYGFDSFKQFGDLPPKQSKARMKRNWVQYNAHSHLTWDEAWPAASHAWSKAQQRAVSH